MSQIDTLRLPCLLFRGLLVASAGQDSQTETAEGTRTMFEFIGKSMIWEGWRVRKDGKLR